MNRPYRHRSYFHGCRRMVLTGVVLSSILYPGMGQAAPSWWPFGTSSAASTGQTSTTAPVKVDNTPVDRSTGNGNGLQFTTSFAPIVKKVSPSVVTVFTTKKVKEQDLRGMPLLQDPFFQRFFGDPGQELKQAPKTPRFHEQRGLGSGVIVSPDGYIVTNVHVVDVADEIKVSLGENDKREYDAKVIGKDELSDVALIKIDAKELPSMVLADSSKVEVGDVVLAIGNPFALGQTVTMGIVSALGRNLGSMDEGNHIEDFIQTDAAINPGNSGGPLVDMNGRMIGLNSAIFSRNGGNLGIGFAIPSNMVHYVMDSLLKQGRVIRGFLGVGTNELTPELARKFNLPDDNGVVVSEVQPNSAAALADVHIGDVIVSFNGKKIDDYRTLRFAVTETPPSQKVKMTVIREGKEKTLDVSLKEYVKEKAVTEATPDNADDAAPAGQSLLPGVDIGDLTPDVRRQFAALQYPSDLKGAVILSVDPDSLAATPGAQGLQAGDVVLEVEHKPVQTAKEAIAAAKNAKGGLLLRVWSHGNPRYLVLKSS